LKRIFLLLFTAILLTACSDSKTIELEQFSNDFLDWYYSTYPITATWIGIHDYDSRMNEVSLESIAKNRAALEKFQLRLSNFHPDKFSIENKIDYKILAGVIDEELFMLTQVKPHEWNPVNYVQSVGSAIMTLISQDFAPQEERITSLQNRLALIPRYLEDAKIMLKTAPKIYTETAIRQNDGIRSLLENGMYDYIVGLPEDSLESIRQSALNAIESVQDFGDWLKQDLLPRSTMDYRIGAEMFDKKFELLLDTPYDPDEILQRAEQDLKSVQEEMYILALPLYKNLARKPQTEASSHSEKLQIVKFILDEIASDHSGRDFVVENARRFIENLTDFVLSHDLITLDDTQPLEIREMPEFMRGFAFAFLENPGPLEEKLKTFYDVSPIPDEWSDEQSESFLREYNNLSVQILSIHEAIPGHYVQLYYSNRYPSIIRSVFYSGTFVEGWAHYAEQMMVDEGYGNNDPRMKLVQLKWRLRVLTNAIIDQKIHKRGMTEEEAISLMMNEGFQEESEAKAKWVRAQLSSTQLSSYYVGAIAIFDLREKYMEKMGDEFELKAFHESLLSHGSPPVMFLTELLLSDGD